MGDESTYGTNKWNKILVGVVGAVTAVVATFYGIAQFEAPIRMKHTATPAANPPAGYQDYYTKSDGSLYKLNSSGTEATVGGGAPTGAAGGGLTGTYPNPTVASLGAISGANLTALNGSNIASGTVGLTVGGTGKTTAAEARLNLNVAGFRNDEGYQASVFTANTTALSSAVWQCMAWSPFLKKFVALSNIGLGMYSSDGTVWGFMSGLPAYDYRDVIWDSVNKRFVGVAYDGATAYSTDGMAWTDKGSLGLSTQLEAIAFAPALNKYVGVADNQVWTISASGYVAGTWVNSSGGTLPTTPRDICWSPELGLFVVVGVGGTNKIATSPDGTTWTGRSIGTGTQAGSSVCWSPELRLFVALSASSSNSMYSYTSPDGITWTQRAGPAAEGTKVRWSAEQRIFVAVNTTGSGSHATISYSSDGITWSAALTGSQDFYHALAYSPQLDLWVCALQHNGSGSGTQTVYLSQNFLSAPAPSALSDGVYNRVETVVGAATTFRDQYGGDSLTINDSGIAPAFANYSLGASGLEFGYFYVKHVTDTNGNVRLELNPSFTTINNQSGQTSIYSSTASFLIVDTATANPRIGMDNGGHMFMFDEAFNLFLDSSSTGITFGYVGTDLILTGNSVNIRDNASLDRVIVAPTYLVFKDETGTTALDISSDQVVLGDPTGSYVKIRQTAAGSPKAALGFDGVDRFKANSSASLIYNEGGGLVAEFASGGNTLGNNLTPLDLFGHPLTIKDTNSVTRCTMDQDLWQFYDWTSTRQILLANDGNVLGNAATPLDLVGSAVTVNGSPIPTTGGDTYVYRTTDASAVNNSTTFVDDGVLEFPIDASGVYVFHYQLNVTSNSTAFFKHRFTGPASPTHVVYNAWVTNSSGGYAPAGTGSSPLWANAFSYSLEGNSYGITNYIVGEGFIINGSNAGTVKLQFAQKTATFVDTKPTVGSYISYKKLN